jgi:hypothetical protein
MSQTGEVGPEQRERSQQQSHHQGVAEQQAAIAEV